MAAAIACASTSLAGLASRLSSNALAGKVNVGQAPVSMKAKATDSIWYGATYLSSLSGATPSYLTGEYRGDCGWDTAGLSFDPGTFAKNRESQQHSVTFVM
ncbi:unnamed protein product [Calypogeia fissa]